MIDWNALTSAERSLLSIGGQDMPVSYDEVWEAMQDYKEELLADCTCGQG